MNIPRLVFAGLVSASLLVSGVGAQISQEEFQTRKEAKLAEEWLAKADWVMDYDQAKADAAKQGKRILAYFTRSYAP